MRLLREATVTAYDGRTLTLDLLGFDVPYFVDDRPDLPGGYDEVWRPGAFRRQESSAFRIDLLYRHRDTVRLGRGQSLREVGGRLIGTYRIDVEPPELVAAFVADRTVGGASIGFDARPEWEHLERRPGRRPRVVRDRGVIEETSLTPKPAYADARVLSVREAAGASAAAAWRVWVDLQASRSPML